MFIELPEEIIKHIIKSIDCNCINHRYSLYLSNKELYKLLNHPWFFKIIINCYDSKKNKYYDKYRKYLTKYHHLQYQIETIYNNSDDESEFSPMSYESIELEDFINLDFN